MNVTLPALPACDAMTERVEVWALMTAYAREAVMAERERCAQMADGYANEDWSGAEGARRVAAAIRSGPP
jgi:hypothetical protein